MTDFLTIRADDLHHVAPNQGMILDVRTKMEHAEKHMVRDHVHIPLDELNPVDFMTHQALGRDSIVYILCRTGRRAAQAAEKFVAAGYHNIKVIEGGIVACEDCDHDIKGYGAAGSVMVTGPACKGPVSLERQVRIAAGLFVVAGAFLGLIVSPFFTLIPLFVGGGLIFAGVTDRCGMALILTRAPWNKTEPEKDMK